MAHAGEPHLPECPVVQFYKPTGVCICDRLRACGQRAYDNGVHDVYQDNFVFTTEAWHREHARIASEALDRATEAVWHDCVDHDCNCQALSAAAIATLRGES